MLLIKQYVTNPFKMAECVQWCTWDRDRFCSELLSAVPDIAVARPESAANFVERMAQVVIRCNLADPFVKDNVDNVIQLIVYCFPDATPELHLRAVKVLISRLPELPINWRIILTRTMNGAEVNFTTVTGFRLTWLAQLARAILAEELAEEYGYEVNYTANTRFNVDKPISKKAPVADLHRLNLNDCTEDASWPIPKITEILRRISTHKAKGSRLSRLYTRLSSGATYTRRTRIHCILRSISIHSFAFWA
jgi:hypothetical protein